MSKHKLKIAMVNKFFFPKGGQETLMFEEARLLEEQGHEVAFFSMEHPENPEDYKYSRYFADYIELSNLGKEYSFFKKLKIAKDFIWNGRNSQFFEDFLLDFQPDVVHCHGIAHQITPAIFEKTRKYNIPVVQTLHDYQIICPNYTLLRSGDYICKDIKCKNGRYYNCIFNKCVKKSIMASILSAIEMYHNFSFKDYISAVDKFISPSKFLLETVVKAIDVEGKIEYIPNFIKIEDYTPEFSNKGYFLYFGRLSFEKGLKTLLQAFKDLPDASLKIVGTGPLESDLHKYKQKNMIKNVEFLGFKSGEELKDIIKFSQAVVLPAEWHENAPMSIIEAFALGKPVIASDLGGIPEMIKENENGWIFKHGDGESLKSKIKLAISNSDNQNFGYKAREQAEQLYTPEIHMTKLIELYNDIIESKA